MPICFPLCREIESARAPLETERSVRAPMHIRSDVDGDAGDSHTDLMLPSESDRGQNTDGNLNTE